MGDSAFQRRAAVEPKLTREYRSRLDDVGLIEALDESRKRRLDRFLRICAPL